MDNFDYDQELEKSYHPENFSMADDEEEKIILEEEEPEHFRHFSNIKGIFLEGIKL